MCTGYTFSKNSAKSVYSYPDKIKLFSFYIFYITNNAFNPVFSDFYIMCPLTSISYIVLNIVWCFDEVMFI